MDVDFYGCTFLEACCSHLPTLAGLDHFPPVELRAFVNRQAGKGFMKRLC